MLFMFPADSDGPFWMKDTLLPLSIAFIDASGRVVRVMDMDPCQTDPCPLYSPGAVYRTALEVERGVLARLGVKAGTLVRIWPGSDGRLPSPQ